MASNTGLLIDSTNLWAGITCLLSLWPLGLPCTTNFTSLNRSLLNMCLLLSLIVGFVVCQFFSITDMVLWLQQRAGRRCFKKLWKLNNMNCFVSQRWSNKFLSHLTDGSRFTLARLSVNRFAHRQIWRWKCAQIADFCDKLSGFPDFEYLAVRGSAVNFRFLPGSWRILIMTK